MSFRLLRIIVGICFLIIFLGCGIANADLGETDSADSLSSPATSYQRAETSNLELGLRLILSIVLVIVLVYLSVWALKKFYSFKTNSGASSANSIQVIDNAYIAPKKGLHIVKVGSKYILVGSSENSMNFLCDLNAEEFSAVTSGKSHRAESRFQGIFSKLKMSADKPFLGKLRNAKELS
ncbi:MAG: flagellar biosynthetic protein FliO [candidate division Zixibacteria bacterium]|nr:flagellar biosynthetic protein FliO [candidate division Zixibacteria bacterium]